MKRPSNSAAADHVLCNMDIHMMTCIILHHTNSNGNLMVIKKFLLCRVSLCELASEATPMHAHTCTCLPHAATCCASCDKQ